MEKGNLNASIDSISVENGTVEVFRSDSSTERRLLLKRDFIMLPTVGLLYMIVSSCQPASNDRIVRLNNLADVLGPHEHRQREDRRSRHRLAYAVKRLQHCVVDLLHPVHPGVSDQTCANRFSMD